MALAKKTSDFETINRDIYLYPPGEWTSFRGLKKGQPRLVAASLDTLCEVGNIISEHLIDRLGMGEYVKPLQEVPAGRDFHERWIEFKGRISFSWKVRDGKTIHPPAEFLMATTDIDLIFGLSYIVEKRLLVPNWSSVAPLVMHRTETLSERANKALLEEEQRQRKARLRDDQASQPALPQASGWPKFYSTPTNASPYTQYAANQTSAAGVSSVLQTSSSTPANASPYTQYAANQTSAAGVSSDWIWSGQYRRYYRWKQNGRGTSECVWAPLGQ